jgi:hypothetical protein
MRSPSQKVVAKPLPLSKKCWANVINALFPVHFPRGSLYQNLLNPVPELAFTGHPPFLDIIVFQGGDDGRGYRNMCKIPRGSNFNKSRWYIVPGWGGYGHYCSITCNRIFFPKGAGMYSKPLVYIYIYIYMCLPGSTVPQCYQH